MSTVSITLNVIIAIPFVTLLPIAKCRNPPSLVFSQLEIHMAVLPGAFSEIGDLFLTSHRQILVLVTVAKCIIHQ